jgi:hypothetical protein
VAPTDQQYGAAVLHGLRSRQSKTCKEGKDGVAARRNTTESVTWFFCIYVWRCRHAAARCPASCAKDGGCRSLASRTDTVTSPHDADVMLGYRLAVYSVLRIDVDGRV